MPNTIADNLQRLTAARTAIGNAIVTKGGTVNSGDGLEEFPADIMSIKNDLTSIDITENGTYYSGEETVVTSSTFPVVVNDSNGTPVRHVDINGNTVQSSTPTPQDPVMPNGTGDKTGNLFPFDDKNFVITAGNSNLTVECKNGNLFFQGNAGEISSNQVAWKNNFAFELEAGTYYCKSPAPLGDGFGRYIKKYDGDATILTSNNYTFTLSEKTKCYLSFYIYQKTLDTKIKLMLNLGSTPLPYEPYGYKLDISSGGENLCNPNLTRYEKTYNAGGIVDFVGGATYLLPIEANTTYTVKIHSDEPISVLRIGLYNEDTPIDGTFVTSLQEKISLSNPTATVTNSNYRYLYVQISGSYINQYGLAHVMINTGSTPLPYEPYNHTTTPLYLGEVPTTRKIKKLVLTGEENFTTGSVIGQYSLKMGQDMIATEFYCSHYPYKPAYQSSGFPYVRQATSSTDTIIWFELDRDYAEDISSGLTKFKAYLAAQYAARTPLTIWYVLATEETGVVNEPLMKIGDYADSLSVDVELPLSQNAKNNIDVDTSLKPSSASFTYNKKNEYIGYNEINVNVPNTYTSEDEGKVVNNGALVAQTAMPTEITTNDTYDTTLYNSIVVNVPSTPIPPFVEIIRYNDNHQPTDIIINNKPDDSLTWMYLSSNIKSIEFKSTPTSLSQNFFTSATSLETVYVPWSENEVNGYPWGAPNTTHFVYDYPNISTSRTINYENDTTSTTGSVLNLRAYNMMGRCNVSDDGTITAYYGDTSYTEDGSNGQVMVYIPKFYYKVNITDKQLVDSTKPEYGYDIHEATYSISDIQLDGYKLHPAFVNANGDEVNYVLCSAFEGSTYDTSASAYNTNDAQTVDFTANTGDLLASIGYVDNSGTTVHVKPASGLTQQLTRPNSMTIAKNRGAGWYALTFKLASAIQMLITVEYGCNSQDNIANGVVGITDNTSYNCASYVGSTVGNTTGRAASTINEINGTETTHTSATTTSVNYRGIENMWGNIWEWVDGINIHGNGSQRGGVPYVCTDMNFSDSKNTDNYESVGFTVANTDGYAKYFGYGNEKYDWVFMTSTVGGSATNAIGDYLYKTPDLNGYRAARLGGTWAYSSAAGVFCWNLRDAASYRARAIGARLMYIPS